MRIIRQNQLGVDMGVGIVARGVPTVVITVPDVPKRYVMAWRIQKHLLKRWYLR